MTLNGIVNNDAMSAMNAVDYFGFQLSPAVNWIFCWKSILNGKTLTTRMPNVYTM